MNGNHQQYRILVVDDDLILNDLFCAFLGSRGFETESATSIESADRILQKTKDLDLLLLDYQLADGFGTDLLDAYNQQGLSIPPVIMISANEDPVFLEVCFTKGIADYIIKPVNLSLLALKVKSLINSVRLQRLVALQKVELEKFKADAQREEAIAKFTYEYLVARNSQGFSGIHQYLQSHSSFSGDIAISRISPGGDVYFLLADATGHGLSAAITIMPLVTVFDNTVAKGFHLQQIVTEINRKLVNDTPADRFVAAVLVELNFSTSEMAIWNGGMPAVYWVENKTIRHKFTSRNMALGILDEGMFDANIAIIDLPNQGTLFMCSDGLLEQQNPYGEQFGIARLEGLLTGSDQLVEKVKEELEIHAGDQHYTDDISICSVDPAAIFAELQAQSSNQINYLHQSINPFSWSIKVSGQKLANADLPPMAIHFLQYIGLNQKSCQTVFAIITELVTNSIDHGILRLSSSLKQSPEGFMQYFLIREKLLANLSDDDFVELHLEWKHINNQKKLIISCRDSGEGYDYTQQPIFDNQQYTGRGLVLVRNLAESAEIFAPGNFIKIIL